MAIKHIVRIAKTDIEGHRPIFVSLRKIKGISFSLANAICNLAGVDKSIKTGELDDAKIKLIDEIVSNPDKNNIPKWMYNRRRDPVKGEDNHLTSGDLDYASENDIKRLRKLKCYRGVRHSSKLPVRGQRTRSNFRKNKGKVTGVKRKK